MNAPLAERLRPKKLSDYISQSHLIGPQGALTQALNQGLIPSMIFWGPPGIGKTTLALNFAFHFDCGIITNERYTMLDKILPNEKFLKLAAEQQVPHIPEEHGIIFDMGGFLDKRVKQAIEQSDYTIIPTTSDKLDMQGAISTIGEIKDITKNIIVVVNKVEKDEDFEDMAERYRLERFEHAIDNAIDDMRDD